jgi:hypothetical protein
LGKNNHLHEPRVLLSGPSNAGLAHAGYRTAFSLADISATITTLEPTLDNKMAIQVLTQLMIEIGDLFEEADKRLAEDISKSAD